MTRFLLDLLAAVPLKRTVVGVKDYTVLRSRIFYLNLASS